jgi:ZIP family zinc transporter
MALIFGIICIMFLKGDRFHNVGTILIGFGILFMGLIFMSDSVGQMSDQLSRLLVAFEDNYFFGFLSGGGLLFVGDKIYSALERENASSPHKKRALLLVFSITLHNIPEGLCVGVAFGSLAYGLSGANLASACLLALGIGLQNFPEGTAVSVPLRREGVSRSRSFFWGQISGAVEPVSGVLGALLVMYVRTLLPFCLSFAAGAMLYVVVEELIPESQSGEKKDVMAIFTLIGFSFMMALDMIFS